MLYLLLLSLVVVGQGFVLGPSQQRRESSSVLRLNAETSLAFPRKKAFRWGDPSTIERRGEGGWTTTNATWRGASRRAWDFVEKPSSYRMSHALLASREYAEEVAEMAKRGDMEELCRLVSTCPFSTEEGGLIGWVDESDSTDHILPAEAKEVLLAEENLRPGDVRVVQSELGWHAVKVDDVFVKIGERGRLRMSGTYAMITMGCQMNAADSERLEGSLRDIGLEPAEDANTADLVVLNTCSIREKAESKVYSALGPHAKRQNCTIVVAGCVAQQEGRRLARRVPQVDIVMGPQYANRLEELLERVQWGEQVVATDPAVITEDAHLGVRPRRSSSVSAWVNVMYGCNERCTYCVVPGTRGVQQSRTPEAILKELKSLEMDGYREATLLGQNVDAYGRDLANPMLFPDLLEKIAQSGTQMRIRFVTSHPRYISPRLVRVVAQYPEVLMPVFHVPAQSGDDDVLRLMGRGYSAKRYLQIVRDIRSVIPDATITSDFIVGCPGESEEAFERTLDLMREVQFDSCMTAAYSPRPSTPMARYDGSDAAFHTLEVDVSGRGGGGGGSGQNSVVQEARDAVEANFKRLAKSQQDNLQELIEARSVARAALDSIDADPLFAFDPLAQIGPAQLDETVKEERLKKILELANEHALSRSQRHLGRVEPVLVEQRNTRRPHQVVGRTRTNKLVFFDGDILQLKGSVVDVMITEALPFSLTGHKV